MSPNEIAIACPDWTEYREKCGLDYLDSEAAKTVAASALTKYPNKKSHT